MLTHAGVKLVDQTADKGFVDTKGRGPGADLVSGSKGMG